jgi:hypothetical protein
MFERLTYRLVGEEVGAVGPTDLGRIQIYMFKYRYIDIDIYM